MADISDQLREEIRASGLSQPKLAELSGVDRPAIGRFLSGERDLTLTTAAKLAMALGLILLKQGAATEPVPKPKAKPAKKAAKKTPKRKSAN